MKVLYVFCTFGLFICLLFSFERPAMAYVDPGSGLFMFQSVSSIGVAALFFLRRRIRMMFRRGPVRPLLRAGAERAQVYGAHAATASELNGKKAA